MLSEAQRYKFLSIPSAETVRRIRQKFQEQGKYKADQKVAKERRYKGYRMQQTNPRVDKVEDVTESAVSWLND